MPLMRPLGAMLRLVRLSRGLSQEELSGAVEARHVHNIENAKSSITLDRLETIAQRLDVDPVALLAYASKVEKGLQRGNTSGFWGMNLKSLRP
ncbi:helix-turn-helix domain-containing protein [Pseudomonas sp. S2_H01]